MNKFKHTATQLVSTMYCAQRMVYDLDRGFKRKAEKNAPEVKAAAESGIQLHKKVENTVYAQVATPVKTIEEATSSPVVQASIKQSSSGFGWIIAGAIVLIIAVVIMA